MIAIIVVAAITACARFRTVIDWPAPWNQVPHGRQMAPARSAGGWVPHGRPMFQDGCPRSLRPHCQSVLSIPTVTQYCRLRKDLGVVVAILRLSLASFLSVATGSNQSKIPAPPTSVRMPGPDAVFIQALPLWVGYVVLPDWRGPIAATCTSTRCVLVAARAHALRTCPSAHGAAKTYRGRLRIDTCSGCGNVQPVYPLRQCSVVRLYHETLQPYTWPPSVRWPGNQVAYAILESPSRDVYTGDPNGVVAWLCDDRQCGGSIWIADPTRNALLRSSLW